MQEFNIEVAECQTCNASTIECFKWYDREDNKPVLKFVQCYECDQDTDPRAAVTMEAIADWAADPTAQWAEWR